MEFACIRFFRILRKLRGMPISQGSGKIRNTSPDFSQFRFTGYFQRSGPGVSFHFRQRTDQLIQRFRISGTFLCRLNIFQQQGLQCIGGLVDFYSLFFGGKILCCFSAVPEFLPDPLKSGYQGSDNKAVGSGFCYGFAVYPVIRPVRTGGRPELPFS